MKKYIASTVLILVCLAVFTGCTTDSKSTQSTEQKIQDKNQESLITAQPAPEVPYSVERQNLIERMKRMNDKNLVGYIYLLADTGQVVTSYVTRGKVTSMKAYLTSYEKLVYGDGSLCGTSATYSCYAVESPDFDGAYGDDPDGIFFFTDTGAQVEWVGRYIWTDQPMSVRTPVSLTRQVK